MEKSFASAPIPEPFRSDLDYRHTWDDCVKVCDAAQDYHPKWLPVLEQLARMTHLSRSSTASETVQISSSAGVRSCLTQLGIHAQKAQVETQPEEKGSALVMANPADAVAAARARKAQH